MSTARQRALLTPVPSDLECRVALLAVCRVAHPVDYLTSCSKHCEHACQQRVSVHYLLRVPSDLECRVALLAVCRVAHPVDYLTSCSKHCEHACQHMHRVSRWSEVDTLIYLPAQLAHRGEDALRSAGCR